MLPIFDHAILLADGARRRTTFWNLAARLTSSLPDNFPPLARCLWRVCFELELVAHAESVPNLALGDVFALDIEFAVREGTDHAIRQVQRCLRDWILGKVIIGFEFMDEFGRRHHVVVGGVGPNLPFALKGTRNEWHSRAVILVREGDVGDRSCRRAGIDEDGVIALDEAVPLEVERDLLRRTHHVSVCHLGLLRLCVDHLHELAHTPLDCLDDVGFELRKRVLHAYQVLPVVVLLLDLFVQTMHDAALEDIGVLCCCHLPTMRLERGCMRAEELDMLLGRCACLVDCLRSLACTFGELLRFVFDLGVQALEGWEDGGLELLCSFVVLVRKALCE